MHVYRVKYTTTLTKFGGDETTSHVDTVEAESMEIIAENGVLVFRNGSTIERAYRSWDFFVRVE